MEIFPDPGKPGNNLTIKRNNNTIHFTEDQFSLKDT